MDFILYQIIPVFNDYIRVNKHEIDTQMNSKDIEQKKKS